MHTIVYELRNSSFIYLEKEESVLLSVSSLIVIDGYFGGLDRVDSNNNNNNNNNIYLKSSIQTSSID